MTQDSSSELREKFRKVIRDYYNNTFEYTLEQFEKGDVSSLIANAETKQKTLDDPYLDEILEFVKSDRQELLKRIEGLPDLIKEVTVSGVAVPRQEMDSITLQDLRLVLPAIINTIRDEI